MNRTLLTYCAALIYAGNVSAVFAGNPNSIKNISVENTLEKCIVFTPKNIEKTTNGVVLHTKAELKKSAAECGCKSTVLSYSVVEKLKIEDEQPEYERLYAQKITPNASINNYPFVISANPEINYQGNVNVKVSCKSPG